MDDNNNLLIYDSAFNVNLIKVNDGDKSDDFEQEMNPVVPIPRLQLYAKSKKSATESL